MMMHNNRPSVNGRLRRNRPVTVAWWKMSVFFVGISLSFAGAPPDSSLKNDAPPSVQTEPVRTDPVLTKFVKAEYPPALLKSGLEGAVALDIYLSAQGRVDSVVLVKSLHPRLDSLAMRAASGFEFTPATAGGVPEPVVLSYDYPFSIAPFLDSLKEYVNFSGVCRESGTRDPVGGAEILITVIDTTRAADSTPVPYARFLERIGAFSGQHFVNGKLTTKADSLGRFSFKSLPTALCSVEVVAANYKKHVSRITLRRREHTKAQFWLENMLEGMNEITVYGKRDQTEISSQTLFAEELHAVTGAAGDAIKAIQSLPGVARPLLGGGEIAVRGGGVNDNRFFLEGIELPYIYHTNFGVPKSIYTTSLLSSLDFFPGGYGVKYGDVIGGVIDISGRPAKTDRWHGTASMGFSEVTGAFEGPIAKNMTLTLSGTRSYLGEYMKLVFDLQSMENPFPVIPSFWDLLVRLDWVTGAGRFLAMYLGSGDVIEQSVSAYEGGSALIDADRDRVKLNKGFNVGIVGWDATLTPSLTNTARLSVGRSVSGFSQFAQIKLDASGTDNFFRDELTWNPIKAFSAHCGVDLALRPYSLKLSVIGDSLYRDTSVFTIGPYSLYGFTECRFGDLTVIPGLRCDYYPQLDYRGSRLPEFGNYTFDNTTKYSAEPSARLAVRYRLSDRLTLKGACGSYNQAPRIDGIAEFGRDAVPMQLAIHEKFGNPRQPPSKASHWTVGNEWQIVSGVSLDIQGYYNSQWDLPRYPLVSELAENPSSLLRADGKARMAGAELFLRYQVREKLSGWLSYSLSRFETYDYGDRRWHLSPRDVPSDAQLIANYQLARFQRLGCRLRYSDGKPYTPVAGVSYDATEMRYIPTWGEINSRRQTPCVSLDMRWEVKKALPHFYLSYYIEMTNMLHFLTFIKGKDGLPIYNPGEIDLWYYDYSGKANMPGFPYGTTGVAIQF
jgi:TonB family protein